MKRDKFEELLHGKLAGTEVKPPADLWARLEAQLPEVRRELAFGGRADEPGIPDALPAPKIRRPLRQKMRWAYVAASVAVVGVMVLSIRNLRDAEMVADGGDDVNKEVVLPIVEPPVRDNTQTEDSEVSTASTQSLTGTVYAGLTAPLRTATPADEAPGQHDNLPPGSTTGLPESIPSTVTDTPEKNASTATGRRDTQDTDKSTVEQDISSDTKGQLTFEEFMRQAIENDGRPSRSKGPLRSATLYAANTTGVTGNGNVTGRVKLQKSSLIVNETTEYPGEETASGTPLRSSDEMTLKHDLPLGFGASVNFGLTRKLSIETGLTYTYMRSKGETVNGGGIARSVNTQKLHYLGIPVKIKYDFFQSRFVDLYAGAGFSVDKLISGKVSSTDYIDNVGSPVGTGKIKVGSLQTSVGANVGVSFNIDEKFGLYAEPGVGYFFENSNQPESYRTEHPFNFTIKAGFRIKL